MQAVPESIDYEAREERRMYEIVPDNYDAFEELEAEQERLQRVRKRLAYAYGKAEGEGWEEEE